MMETHLLKKKIYIIDDNPDMREVLVMLIEEEKDLEVCGMAETATEALRSLHDLNPDLVIADLSLPGMNGIEFVGCLSKLRPRLRATILSAYTETAYAEQAVAAGAKGYILKGDPVAIIEGIRRVLNGELYVSSMMRTPAIMEYVSTRVET